MFKKIILSILASLILLFSFAPKIALAQSGSETWYNQSFKEWFSKVNDSASTEIFGERYTAAQVQWVIYGLFYFIINGATNGNTDALSCVITKDLEECKNAILNLKNPLPKLNTPGQSSEKTTWTNIFTSHPISSLAYFKDVGQRLRLVPEAKAQGFGFEAANPTLRLWKIARNVTYSLLIVVITIMAFMIMFRVKISPQTVITVQSALPKVVITLILITFSYAIAGLLIDLMYVIIGLVAGLLTSNSISSWNWSTMFGALTTDRNAFLLLVYYWLAFLITTFVDIFSGAIIPGFFAFIFAIVVIVILLWFSIKIIILLLKTYIQIVLLIIAAPFQILLGAVVPGAGFNSWLRSMAANLLVYPLTGLLFVVAFIFLRAGLPAEWLANSIMPFDIQGGFLNGRPWAPPLTFGTGGADTSHLLWALVSFGVIILIPKVADIIQGAIQGKPFAFGTAIGEALGPARIGGAAYGMYAARQLQAEGIPIPFGGRWAGRITNKIPENIRARLGDAIEGLVRALT